MDKYQPAPPVVDYDLTITTDVSAPKDLKAGSKDPISDVIHASQSRGCGAGDGEVDRSFRWQQVCAGEECDP